jgi:hypothetical protein
VIRDREERKFILYQAYHETRNPETVGHLRNLRPWYQQTEGEEFSEKNDGMMTSHIKK